MRSQPNILYVSTLCSKQTSDNLFFSANGKQRLTAQKFHRLIVEGLILNNHQIDVLSSLPVSRSSHPRIFWKWHSERVESIWYHYPFFINLPVLRQVLIFLGGFLYTICWCIKNRNTEKVVICDTLNIAITLAARIATRIAGIKVIAIVTDLQKNMGAARNDNKHKKLLPKLITGFSSSFINSFDYYVILTGQMNEVINTKKKPFIVMEGLVDIKMKELEHEELNDKEKVIIYAGGIYEKYGVRKLIDAFYNIKQKNVKLYIYGSGEMEKDMSFLMERDPRLKYFGMVANEIVVKMQLSATLLINPRPTTDEFTKYSFPSKNMEYMVSGTPLVTTLLPGMPSEYNDFIYLLLNETVEGIQKVLRDLLNKPTHELSTFGKKAKRFVLDNKNNVIQSQRIMNLVE